jgi:uncharacterized RDD family membrane protein YckC
MATIGPLDTRVDIIAPENIAFQYRVAGPFQRLPAYLIDLFVRVAVMLGIGLVSTFTLGSTGTPGLALAVVVVTWFLLSWFYGGLFEAVANGQTPGKRVMRLRVLTVDGEPIAAWQAILRNILRTADMMPVAALPWAESGSEILPLFSFGLASCLVTQRYQRLGDLACGTIVVVEQTDPLRGIMPVADRAVIDLAGELPVGMRVSRSLARALAAYVSRRNSLSPARREEMARSLAEAVMDHYGLRSETSHDRLLCAVYYRAYVTDRRDLPDATKGPPPLPDAEAFQVVPVEEPVQK